MRFCSFWFYPSAAAILVYSRDSGSRRQRSFVDYLWLGPAGLVIWTLLEYGLHRFVFHWSPSNPSLRKLVYQFHLAHHADPRNPNKILVRPLFSIPISALILAIRARVDRQPLVGCRRDDGPLGGIPLLRVGPLQRTRQLSFYIGVDWHRRRHFYHHFIDERNCYGVTSPRLGPVVFGTFKKL